MMKEFLRDFSYVTYGGVDRLNKEDNWCLKKKKELR